MTIFYKEQMSDMFFIKSGANADYNWVLLKFPKKNKCPN